MTTATPDERHANAAPTQTIQTRMFPAEAASIYEEVL